MTVQEAGLRTFDDPTILEWAAEEGRTLITRDLSTIPTFAHQRVAAGKAMPGAFALRKSATMAPVIEELAMIAGASDADEWVNQVIYVPLL